ncbi:MAG: hypothetical protein H7338_07840 [Candidatus Sericytochromatia bacterium]|nr:hypothetical protein [Candidatus Sericytochromatia bacterium]
MRRVASSRYVSPIASSRCRHCHHSRRPISRHRFEIIEAVDGADGLRMIRAARRAMIISDSEMPGSDGLALMAPLAADPPLAGIPVILTVGKALHEE